MCGWSKHQDVVPYYILTALINPRCRIARLIGYDGGMDFLFSLIAFILEPLALWWMRDKPHGRSKRDK